MRTPRVVVLAATGVAATLVLAACSGTGRLADASGAPSSTTSAVAPSTDPVTPTSPAPTTTPSTTPSATPSPTATRTSSATAAPSVRPSWPKALGEPQQGDPVWAVYLAVGHSVDDQVVQDAVEDAASVGYQAVVGDIACDGGATKALGLDEYDYWSGATVYFATEKQARGFAAAWTA